MLTLGRLSEVTCCNVAFQVGDVGRYVPPLGRAQPPATTYLPRPRSFFLTAKIWKRQKKMRLEPKLSIFAVVRDCPTSIDENFIDVARERQPPTNPNQDGALTEAEAN